MSRTSRFDHRGRDPGDQREGRVRPGHGVRRDAAVRGDVALPHDPLVPRRAPRQHDGHDGARRHVHRQPHVSAAAQSEPHQRQVHQPTHRARARLW